MPDSFTSQVVTLVIDRVAFLAEAHAKELSEMIADCLAGRVLTDAVKTKAVAMKDMAVKLDDSWMWKEVDFYEAYCTATEALIKFEGEWGAANTLDEKSLNQEKWVPLVKDLRNGLASLKARASNDDLDTLFVRVRELRRISVFGGEQSAREMSDVFIKRGDAFMNEVVQTCLHGLNGLVACAAEACLVSQSAAEKEDFFSEASVIDKIITNPGYKTLAAVSKTRAFNMWTPRI